MYLGERGVECYITKMNNAPKKENPKSKHLLLYDYLFFFLLDIHFPSLDQDLNRQGRRAHHVSGATWDTEDTGFLPKWSHNPTVKTNVEIREILGRNNKFQSRGRENWLHTFKGQKSYMWLKHSEKVYKRQRRLDWILGKILKGKRHSRKDGWHEWRLSSGKRQCIFEKY